MTPYANRRIQDYLGHRCITHAVCYTELDDRKFDDLWGDDPIEK